MKVAAAIAGASFARSKVLQCSIAQLTNHGTPVAPPQLEHRGCLTLKRIDVYTGFKLKVSYSRPPQGAVRPRETTSVPRQKRPFQQASTEASERVVGGAPMGRLR